MRELDSSSATGAEADAVIGAVHVVVHCFRTRDDVQSLIVKTLAVTERVVSSDRNQNIDTDVLEILENILGDVIDRLIVSIQMRRNSAKWQVTRPGSRCVEERSTGSTCAIYNRLGKIRNALGVVGAV